MLRDILTLLKGIEAGARAAVSDPSEAPAAYFRLYSDGSGSFVAGDKQAIRFTSLSELQALIYPPEQDADYVDE